MNPILLRLSGATIATELHFRCEFSAAIRAVPIAGYGRSALTAELHTGLSSAPHCPHLVAAGTPAGAALAGGAGCATVEPCPALAAGTPTPAALRLPIRRTCRQILCQSRPGQETAELVLGLVAS